MCSRRSAVLILVLSLALIARAGEPSAEAEALTRGFVVALSSNEPLKAYGVLSEETRAETSFEEFSELVSSFGLIGELKSLEVDSVRALADPCEEIILIGGFEYGEIRLKFHVCEEEGARRIGFFDMEALRIDREFSARSLIVTTLRGFGVPDPDHFECPGIDETEPGKIAECRADFGGGCTYTFRLEVNPGGFVIIDGEQTDACGSRFE